MLVSDNLDISVVICAYAEDRWDALAAAVESVRQQTARPREIIVVIDHNPSLLDRVRGHMPDVIALENTRLAGASGARNTGVAVATGQIVAFLDDDAEAAATWLARLLPYYSDGSVLGVGGWDRASLGERAAELVPRRISLGRRMFLSRAATKY